MHADEVHVGQRADNLSMDLPAPTNVDSRLHRAPSLSAPARALLMAVRVYQTFFSAMMPSACKFYPTCSHYAAEAIQVHGARRGTWLALRRIGRCHPFTRGGVDLVPDAASENSPAFASQEDMHRGAHDEPAAHASRGVHS